jgi:phage gpG-like protein
MAAAFKFEVTLDGEHLIRVLNRARAEISGNELLTSIGLSLKRRNQMRNAKAVEPDGTAWEPLSKRTILKKTDPRMLVETGDMLLRNVYSHASGGAVTIGYGDHKAYWHHHGTIWKPKSKDVESGKKNYFEHATKQIPARPLVGFPTSDKVFVSDLIEDHLKAVLNRN